MKTNNSLEITILISLFFLVVSCEKGKDIKPVDPSITEITGTYNGEFFPVTSPDSVTSGQAIVTSADNSQLTIQCISEDMDTTFIVDAFDDGDSVMVCYTGQDFTDMYGHMEDDDNMMMHMEDSNETDWMRHLEMNHSDGDTHPGGFDKKDHTFFYSMKVMNGNSEQLVRFEGVKE